MTQPPVYIVDALNYIFRAYYSVPAGMTSPSGMPTNAILGYLRMLLRIIKERQPRYMAAAFEGDRSFRNDVFTQYKANRTETPADLLPQIDYCRKITEAIGIASFECPGYEADDVIGTIAVRMRLLGHSAVIVSGDKDMSQLVGDGVSMYDFAKEIWLDEAGVFERFGVRPVQIPDLLALLGDSVDNIPGVPGVGEKTARQLLAVCSGINDLEDPDDRFCRLPIRSRERILQRIRNSMEAIRMSRVLATIRCDVNVDISSEALRYRRGDSATVETLCAELGLKRVLGDIPMAQTMLF